MTQGDKFKARAEADASAAIQACARCCHPVPVDELVAVKGAAMCDLCADEVMDREADAMRGAPLILRLHPSPLPLAE